MVEYHFALVKYRVDFWPFLRSSKEWNRVFYLDITELYQNLFITLYDEDENDADDFMGKLCVPILEMKGQFKPFY